MALADRLFAPPQPVPACGLRAYLDALDDPDRAALQVALSNPDWSTSALHRALRAEGFTQGLTTVQRHRRGTCSCGAR